MEYLNISECCVAVTPFEKDMSYLLGPSWNNFHFWTLYTHSLFWGIDFLAPPESFSILLTYNHIQGQVCILWGSWWIKIGNFCSEGCPPKAISFDHNNFHNCQCCLLGFFCLMPFFLGHGAVETLYNANWRPYEMLMVLTCTLPQDLHRAQLDSVYTPLVPLNVT